MIRRRRSGVFSVCIPQEKQLDWLRPVKQGDLNHGIVAMFFVKISGNFPESVALQQKVRYNYHYKWIGPKQAIL